MVRVEEASGVIRKLMMRESSVSVELSDLEFDVLVCLECRLICQVQCDTLRELLNSLLVLLGSVLLIPRILNLA